MHVLNMITWTLAIFAQVRESKIHISAAGKFSFALHPLKTRAIFWSSPVVLNTYDNALLVAVRIYAPNQKSIVRSMEDYHQRVEHLHV